MFRQRSRAPGPGPSALPGDLARTTNGAVSAGPDGTTSGELDAHLPQAEEHVNLGLPVGASERFRLVKRLVYRVSWPILRHQIAFNQAIMQANRELEERITRLQERIEQGLRDDVLDFADRSASQAHAEISDHVAEARHIHADLILELRTLQAELATMAKTVMPTLPPDQGPVGLERQRDATGVDGGAHESHR
jgi:hypothetical protein